MEIKYLGHAGFSVETKNTIILMDPWLSEHGAFDASWFQFPKNHNLAGYVQDLFNSSAKDKYIYISHEHKDHFDISFLKSLKNRDFTIILAEFVRPVVKDILQSQNYDCTRIIELKNEEAFSFKDGKLVLYTIDAELECDSAILVHAEDRVFLNLNDCKLHEFLPEIKEEYQHIHVFAAQFSGAIWHPTCYDMSRERYEQISEEKKLIKFKLTAKAIECLEPDLYIPSAGPVCFLDPELMHINFEKINIFPMAPELINYLNENCTSKRTQWPEVMPGDVFDTQSMAFIHRQEEPVSQHNVKNYIINYASQYKEFFNQREQSNRQVNPKEVFKLLHQDLQNKIDNVKLINKSVTELLYWKLKEHPEILKVNFHEKSISITNEIGNENGYWFIEAPAWQVNKIYTKEINWPDFALTFRTRIKRSPDKYVTLIHGFITLDAESISRFCELTHNYHLSKERITIDHQGTKYSIIRYCPHQGGDLSKGWIEDNCIVCPRHRWKFSLVNGGKCKHNAETISAIILNKEHDDG